MPSLRFAKRGWLTGSGRPRLRRKAIALFLFVAVGAAVWISGLPALAYFQATLVFAAPPAGPTLSLGDYEAEVQARTITGLSRDISGLTYSPTTGTLFAVANRPPRIVELSTDGKLLRMVDLDGVKDRRASPMSRVTASSFPANATRACTGSPSGVTRPG